MALTASLSLALFGGLAREQRVQEAQASRDVPGPQRRASYERAESDRINASYEYHKAFAALESAVGRPLR